MSWHLTRGRYSLINKDGSIAKEGDWQSNFLAQEGEQSILNVYLLEQANPTKYLCLLSGTPTKTTTMATMTEAVTPGSNGYNRQQAVAANWSATALDAGDYQTSQTVLTFGPATGSAWSSITYAAVVTTSTGTSGKFICAIQLQGSSSTTVNVGQSLKFTLSSKAFSVPS